MTIQATVRMLFLLFAAHALCDYALQSDFIAKGKNPALPLPGVPWYQVMLGHCLIHAGAVMWITGSLKLGLSELFFHFWIDYCKCMGYFGKTVEKPRGMGEDQFKRLSPNFKRMLGSYSLGPFNTDQALHYFCKIAWVVCLWEISQP